MTESPTKKPCIDCVRQGNTEPKERYKSTSYCREHNTARVRESQKNSGLKQIIARGSWADLQKRRADNTYQYSYVQLHPLIQHYRELAEKAAEVAVLTEDRDSPDFLEPAKEAEQYAIIARSLQLKRPLTGAERGELLDELGLTARSRYLDDWGTADAVEPVGEAARVDDEEVYASAEDTSWQQDLDKLGQRWKTS